MATTAVGGPGVGTATPPGPSVSLRTDRVAAVRRTGQLVWLAAMAVGLALRVLLMVDGFTPLDSDESVVWLQAQAASHGHLSAFFAGQNYGGALEQAVVGALIRLAGTHLWLLPAVSTVLSVAAAALFYRLADELFGRPTAQLATAVFWVGDSWLVWFSLHDGGFYQAAMAFSLAAALLAARRWRLRTASGTFLLGVTAGVAFWCTPLSLTLLVPVLIGFLLTRPRAGALALSAVGAALGAGPWLYATLAERANSARPRSALGGLSTILGRAHHAATLILPSSLGTFAPHLSPPAGLLAAAGLVVVVAATVVTVVALLRRQVVLALVAVQVPVWTAVLTFSGTVIGPGRARYSYLALPAMALLAAEGLRALGGPLRMRGPRPGALLPAAAAVLLTGITAANLLGATAGFRRAPDGFRQPAVVALAGHLRASGRTDIYADYWVSYALDAEAPTVSAASLFPQRLPDYDRAAAEATRTTVVVLAGRYDDRQLDRLARREHGRRLLIDGYAVYEFPDRVAILSRAAWQGF